MSMSKNIARLAVTAGLTATLSFGGVMAPVTMAFAAEGDGSITISQAEKNDGTTFKAYQIFKATVTDTENGGKTAQNITWASDTVSTKVIDAIRKDWKGYGGLEVKDQLSDKPTAQEVADFLMAHAGSTTAGSTSTDGTRIATNNVLYAVANAVKSEKPAATNIPTGNSWTPDLANGNGYYLFVTSDLDSTKPNTGTSPIFAVVGGSAVTVHEKTSIPTVEKKILDDSKVKGGDITGEIDWVDAADSQIGQEVNYRLTGTIADNYDSYDTYSYKFKDQLTDGLDYITDSISVYALNNGEYTEINPTSYDVDAPSESNQRVLTVNFMEPMAEVSHREKWRNAYDQCQHQYCCLLQGKAQTQRRLLQGPTTSWRATPILLRSSILTTPWSQVLAPRNPIRSRTTPTASRSTRLTLALRRRWKVLRSPSQLVTQLTVTRTAQTLNMSRVTAL